ncbi:beta-glucosidase family protein [Natrinema amylolyticum]|uniref:beta-glucosidase family protein n=1 Tax=Natrinema amylolyticum TaxID=2878679 RepID=UPI001CFC1E3F|nr:glycoside hydrolase family 3 C-terminal domain-containing protein [Natrinema amylolyticum]
MQSDSASLVDDLTLEEKIDLVHGSLDPNGKATGYVPGNDRVGIPELTMVDGPLGVRALGEQATAFPSSIALASSWDSSVARSFGTALGREAAAHDQDVVLGPGVNIIRTPHGGRNFEYYSEDPHLTARMGVGTIDGIQSEGVAAMVKHYVANNQETNRYEVSAEVSERALREIYLPAFRAAVEEADVLSVMTAYNRVNGVHMSDHERLLSDVLKGEWGFDGLVVSDWWGTRSTVEAALAGLDIEMPGVELEAYLPDEADDDADGPDDEDGELPPIPDVPAYFGEPLREAIESGAVDESILDEKISRLLRLMESVGRFEDDEHEGELDTPEHRQLAREIAVDGTVMLTNDGALPLDESDSIALIGPNADAAKLGGGGSSEVSPITETSPHDGLAERAADLSFERGVPPIAESSFFDDADVDESVTDAADASIDDAVSAAETADCAVIVAQDNATEFKDRDHIELPGDQNELISAVAEGADRTVVVLRTSGPVELPWLDAVDAVLETWYPGQADGEALAAVLFGDADPGGRLPVTFGRSAVDYPTADEAAFPGVDGEARYDEGVFVGYRYFDDREIEPLFPFGHGLSYATVKYDDATVSETDDGYEVTVDLRNVSDRIGTEVAQVYARKSAAPVDCPDRELVGFEKVTLESGEEATVTVSLDRDDFAYYDETDGWTIADGPNTVLVGRSSRDVRATFDVDV